MSAFWCKKLIKGHSIVPLSKFAAKYELEDGPAAEGADCYGYPGEGSQLVFNPECACPILESFVAN
jgi:hypothetical protein